MILEAFCSVWPLGPTLLFERMPAERRALHAHKTKEIIVTELRSQESKYGYENTVEIPTAPRRFYRRSPIDRICSSATLPNASANRASLPGDRQASAHDRGQVGRFVKYYVNEEDHPVPRRQ